MGLIRTWLRVPDTAALLLATCGAAYAAVALGALGGFLGWRTAPPLPSDADAVRMARPAYLGTLIAVGVLLLIAAPRADERRAPG